MQHKQISSRVERWAYEGSVWAINSILQHQLAISKISPWEGRSYFPLPKELRNPMKELINIQNEDNECFRWCLVKYLNPVNKKSAKIRNVDKEFTKKLNFKRVKFPVHKKVYAKIESQISISVNVFGYEDKIPYRFYTSKPTFEKHVGLLLLSNSEKLLYF